jgi:hypothetical protein
MTRATAAALHGRSYRVLGEPGAFFLRPVLAGANRLPASVRRFIYSVGSGREGLRPSVVARADENDLSRQVTEQFPRRPYQAIAIGSTPGSAVHLCTALGVPLLAQTMLLPLARAADTDDPAGDIEAARPTVRAMLDRNPGLSVHQMFDPSSDRVTLRWFSYLRTKKLRLGPVYESFISETLVPGGTLLILDSEHSWPVTRLGDRHVFQFGGVSGLEPDEYLHGSDRVERFLHQQGSSLDRWHAPEPDEVRPEAEWGFDARLGEDVERFAAENGYRVLRLRFDRADGLSPVVADLYRWWYGRLGRPSTHLFVESFVLLDPVLAIERAAVPFWLTFNGNHGVPVLRDYLASRPPFDIVDLTMISNGVDAIGLAPIDAWQDILDRPRVAGRLAGVDDRAFPLDLAVYARYRDNLARSAERYPRPEPLSLEDVVGFLASSDVPGITLSEPAARP